MQDEGDHVQEAPQDASPQDADSNEQNLLGRIEVLENDNNKLNELVQSLIHRIETLESDSQNVEDDEKSSKPSKKKEKKEKRTKSVKKSQMEKKNTKKKQKLANEGEKKASRVRGKTKTNFYHCCGHKIYVDVPEPFKFGQAIGKPKRSLELTWAYGYQGGNSGIHHNIAVIDKELVYALAGVAVVYNPEEQKQRFFTGHSEDVISIAQNPDEPHIFATGQRDPKDGVGEEDHPYTCIWDSKDGCTEKKRIRYGERGVVSVGFTHDGKYIWVVGDDDSRTGALFDWKENCTKPVAKMGCSKAEVWGQSHAGQLFEDKYQWVTFGEKVIKWFSYNPNAEENPLEVNSPQSFSKTKITQSSFHCAAWTSDLDLLTGCHSGHIYLFNKRDHKITKWWEVSSSPVEDIKWLGDDAKESEGAVIRAVTVGGEVVYFNSKWKELERKKTKVKQVTAVAQIEDTLYIGNKHSKVHAVTIPDFESKAVITGNTKEIWGLATHPTQPYLCVGCDDKTLRVLDYSNKTVVFQKKSKHGFRTADFSRQGDRLALGCTDGSLLVVSMARESMGDVIYDKKICKEEVSCVVFTKDGNKIILGSWDQTLRVIKCNKKNFPCKTMKGHTSSITHIDVSEDGKFVQSASKDAEVLYWDTETCKRLDDMENNVVWDRWNIIFGWPVQGLFHQAGDITDVNCCEVSGGNEVDDEKGMKVVASGDDTGHVTLFKYPVLQEKPKFKQFLAHSAHVTNVKFSENDEWLFSAGGGDLAVFQWKVVDSES